MNELILYLVTFLIILLLYVIFIIFNKRRLEKFKENMYVTYLVRVYHLDIRKIRMKDMAFAIAIINSFIISTTILILGVISNLILKFVLGFIILIPLQLIMYHIVGKIFQKNFKEEK